MDWDDATILRLRELWAAGHSGSEIGRRLGTSKGAVVGKAHRLELEARPSPIRRDVVRPTERPARLTENTLPPLQSVSADKVVTRLLIEGRSNRTTAAEAGVSVHQVKKIRRAISVPLNQPALKPTIRTLPALVSEAAPVLRPVVPPPDPEPPRIDASRVCQFMSGHRHHWVPCGKPAIGSWCPEHRRKVFVQRRERGEEAA